MDSERRFSLTSHHRFLISRSTIPQKSAFRRGIGMLARTCAHPSTHPLTTAPSLDQLPHPLSPCHHSPYTPEVLLFPFFFSFSFSIPGMMTFPDITNPDYPNLLAISPVAGSTSPWPARNRKIRKMTSVRTAKLPIPKSSTSPHLPATVSP